MVGPEAQALADRLLSRSISTHSTASDQERRDLQLASRALRTLLDEVDRVASQCDDTARPSDRRGRVLMALDRLIVKFHRGGRNIETEHASSGERALKIALLMLARLDDLQAGDALLCVADIDGKPLPPPRTRNA